MDLHTGNDKTPIKIDRFGHVNYYFLWWKMMLRNVDGHEMTNVILCHVIFVFVEYNFPTSHLEELPTTP